MRFFLRLKHWQLFIPTVGLPTMLSIFGSGRTGPFDIVAGILMALGVFGWVWSIANELYKKMPGRETRKLRTFRFLFLTALTILILESWTFDFAPIATSAEFTVAFLLVLVYLGLMMFSVLFAAKALKSVELGRAAEFKDYSGEAFLIWMIPIGVWLIQPRLNKLTDN